VWLPSDTSVDASKSIHYVLSLESRPTPYIDFNFDLYYKTMTGIGEINQMNFMNANMEKVTDVLFIGNAYSYGAEVFLQKSAGRLTG